MLDGNSLIYLLIVYRGIKHGVSSLIRVFLLTILDGGGSLQPDGSDGILYVVENPRHCSEEAIQYIGGVCIRAGNGPVA
jgi:hypothetical protein